MARRVSFRDILVGSKNMGGLNMHDQEEDDLQLLERDVTIGMKDGMPSIHFSDRVHQIL
ncbi:hypothetical protein PVK06_039542 [Gossypium arboreum]|uniref:Uncharacterized protein n=1 Tax=Gossypium arboreum TaxID=29729 RepID=A0ABR0N3D8_GOSAR|nr:hypothetical protein PVK06_039542 [Gossypium arboreum]